MPCRLKQFNFLKGNIFKQGVPMNVKILLCLITLSCNCIHSLASDFNGSGTDDIAIFRPSTGLWAVRGVTRCYYGKDGDIPATSDYDGDGCSDITIFRPVSGLWAIRNITQGYFGKEGDIPITGGGTKRAYNPDVFQVDDMSGIVRVGYNTQNSGFEVGRSYLHNPSPDWPDGIGHNVTFYSAWDQGDGRFVWDNDRNALRVIKYPSDTGWELVPGYCSISVGYDASATGNSAAAFGSRVSASGFGSLASGDYSFASGDRSVCLGGLYGFASGTNSVAIGQFVKAEADNAIVIGRGAGNIGDIFTYLVNDKPDSLMVGFNTDTDPSLFVDSYGVGVGMTSPARKLHVKDVMRLEPRSTAPDNPSQGDLYFDSTDAKLKCYDGSSWRDCF